MIYRTPAKKSDNALFAKTILFLVLVLIIFVFFVPFSAVAKRLSTIWPISILSSWARGKETLV